MAKKRSIDEYRQVKDAIYVTPNSHITNENHITHKFTNKQLFNYMEKFMMDTFFDDFDELPKDLHDALESYIKGDQIP